MSSAEGAAAEAGGAGGADAEFDDLAAELALVRAENRRLRRAYDRAHQVTYRRTALGLLGVGIAGLLAAALLPELRTVLLVLGAIGVFAGVLTVYLTPERFVPAAVGEQVYAAGARSRSALAGELGLTGTPVYVPGAGGADARLFVPQHDEAPLPATEALRSTLVVAEEPASRGVAFEPTGVGLYREARRLLDVPQGAAPGELAELLVESVVEGFELARAGSVDADPDGGRLSVTIRDAAYGPPDRFDHPIVSLLAVGLADALRTPVRVADVAEEGDAAVVTLSWSPADGE